MKNAIKREQSQARLSFAEREHFGASLNKKYMKPAMQVYELKNQRMLAASEQLDLYNDETTEQW
jgi:hypothetical protein